MIEFLLRQQPEMSAKQEQTKKECFATAMPGATYPSSSADMKAIYCDAANAPKIDAVSLSDCYHLSKTSHVSIFSSESAWDRSAAKQ